MFDAQADRILKEVALRFARNKNIRCLGDMFRKLREDNHYTYKGVADKTGLSEVWIALFEHGLVEPSELADEVLMQLLSGFPSIKMSREDFVGVCHLILAAEMSS